MRKILALALSFFFAVNASAEVVHYQDDTGKHHYVDSPTKVPERYRSQLEGQQSLPPISRAQPGRENLYEQKSYPQAASVPVEIFVTSWCPHCRELEAYLRERQISFARYDIEENAAGRARYEQFGGGGVPVIRIGRSVLHGFNPMHVDAALNLNR